MNELQLAFERLRLPTSLYDMNESKLKSIRGVPLPEDLIVQMEPEWRKAYLRSFNLPPNLINGLLIQYKMRRLSFLLGKVGLIDYYSFFANETTKADLITVASQYVSNIEYFEYLVRTVMPKQRIQIMPNFELGERMFEVLNKYGISYEKPREGVYSFLLDEDTTIFTPDLTYLRGMDANTALELSHEFGLARTIQILADGINVEALANLPSVNVKYHPYAARGGLNFVLSL